MSRPSSGPSWPARLPRQPLRASLVGPADGPAPGAACAAEWDGDAAQALGWDEVFATTGLFGVEIGPAAEALAGQRVELRGHMTPPILAEADYFVLTRSPVPNCPFCVPMASWPDDTVLVHLRAPGVDIDHSARAVLVRGLLELGEHAGTMPGLTSHVRILDALWQPDAGPAQA